MKTNFTNQILKGGVAFVAMLAATFAFTSCDNEAGAPTINVEENPFVVEAKGGNYTVKYTISNPIVGARLSADTDNEWIDDLDTSVEKIKFTVLPNYSEAGRTALIELYYDGAEKVILRVKQKGAVNELNGHKLVDLGLSVKWATCNIGAEDVNEAGNYYMWGDLVDRKADGYTSSSYPYITKSYVQEKDENGQPKFDETTGEPIMTEVWGYEDLGENISGSELYDVARKEWGATWRIPTSEEVQELLLNCVGVQTKHKSTNGVKFTSKINGAEIFIPSAGYYLGGAELMGFNSVGCYWTATNTMIEEGMDANTAFYLMLSSGGTNSLRKTNYHSVHPIRPVTE